MSFFRLASKLPKLSSPITASSSRLYSTAPAAPSRFLSKLRSGVISSVLVLGTGAFLVYSHDSSAGVHRWVFLPALGLLTADNPEQAHEIAVKFIGSGLAPVDQGVDAESLAFELWGRQYSNPIGMAAGFDKHGEAIDGLFNLGFGYVEIGSVTPEPQPGNPKPRVFRIPETDSLINRYGFNSEGHSTVVGRLRQRVLQFVSQNALSFPPSIFPFPPPNSLPQYDVVAQLLASPAGAAALVPDTLGLPRSLIPGQVLAVNLGKNKASTPDSIEDFVKGVESLGPYADILVVNVSSPNTPGLRSLQRKGMLEDLLTSVVKARDDLKSSATPSTYTPPILVKIAPDLTSEEISDIAHAVQASKIDGIIISNTTISRPASAGTSLALHEAGGLSGPPVKPLALRCIKELYQATEGKVVLIGCGGISSGADAVEFAKAGATMVQLYTGFIYGGIGLPRKIKDELEVILKEENKNWVDLIGTGVDLTKKVEVVVVPEVVEIESLIGEVEELGNVVKELEVLQSEDSTTLPPPSSSTSTLELLDTQALSELFQPDDISSPPPPAAVSTSTVETTEPIVAEVVKEESKPVEVEIESVAVPVVVVEPVVVAVEEPAKPSVVLEELKKTLPPVKGEGKRWV